MSKPNVSFAMLDASTAHLSEQTRTLLENDDIEGVLLYPKGPWGWFVHVPELEIGESAGDQVPEDLKVCVEFAQQAGFQWIMFDADGSFVEGLPVFDESFIDKGVNPGIPGNSDSEGRVLAQSYARHLSQKLGREIKGTYGVNGKIFIAEDVEGGIYGNVSKEFALAMVLSALPVREQQTAEVAA